MLAWMELHFMSDKEARSLDERNDQCLRQPPNSPPLFFASASMADSIVAQCGVWWPLIAGGWGVIGGALLASFVIYMRPWLINLKHDEEAE